MNHRAELKGSYTTGAEAPFEYGNTFECIPYSNTSPFRPARTTRKARVEGPQTAVVVGPEGEEIFCDKYGRVKVQFLWDRQGQLDANSSCWLRVAQPLAGQGWGMITIPRIGQEVVVAFLEGDPDRPIITGSVYNAEQMPPFTLPDYRTKTAIKTHSYNNGDQVNFHGIAFEDTKGSEHLQIHSEKDMAITVENDHRVRVPNNHITIVGGFFSFGSGGGSSGSGGGEPSTTVPTTMGSSTAATADGGSGCGGGDSWDWYMGNQFNYTWGFTHTYKAGLTHSFVAGMSWTITVNPLSFIVDDLAAPYISKVTGAVTGRLAQGAKLLARGSGVTFGGSTSINYGQSIGLNRGGSKVDLIDKPNLFQKSLAYLSVITNSVAMIVSGFEDQWGSIPYAAISETSSNC